ncbi:MAG: SCO family protein [candidate division NC10 bacterium]|nr:SCO family protein [candidate division NC10 bacterium]
MTKGTVLDSLAAVSVARMAALALLCACTVPLSGTPRAAAHQDPPAAQSSRPALAPAARLPLIKPAPDFTLLDTSGRPIRLSELRGKVVLISFIYTACSSACPLLTQRMALLQARLARSGLRRREAQFLSITVDPYRDSAEVLGRYAARLRAGSDGWRFLREEPERLKPVLTAYDEWTRPQPDGEIDHPARLYLVDQRGNIREIYSLSFFDERQAFRDIQALLKEAR